MAGKRNAIEHLDWLPAYMIDHCNMMFGWASLNIDSVLTFQPNAAFFPPCNLRGPNLQNLNMHACFEKIFAPSQISFVFASLSHLNAPRQKRHPWESSTTKTPANQKEHNGPSHISHKVFWKTSWWSQRLLGIYSVDRQDKSGTLWTVCPVTAQHFGKKHHLNSQTWWW